MARKKQQPATFIVPTYYVYYEMPSGDLLAFCNERNTSYEHELVVPYELYDKFVSGKEIFKDWVVVRTKNPDIASGMEIVPRNQQEIYFKNNMFEWIKDAPDENTEFTVHWSLGEQMWIFLISDAARQRMYDKQIKSYELTFFITLETDFDFLIRTITFDTDDLILDKICIPFENKLEEKIDKLSVSTRSVFGSYGLAVWKGNDEQN